MYNVHMLCAAGKCRDAETVIREAERDCQSIDPTENLKEAQRILSEATFMMEWLLSSEREGWSSGR